MNRGSAALVAVVALTVTACAGGARSRPGEVSQKEDAWFQAGEAAIARAEQRRPIEGRAKNVILFIGDGLDVSTVTAARIYQGQLRGESGEENALSFEAMPHRALLKTYNTNQQVADSAGSGTALLAGAKTKAGVIGLDQDVLRGDCASASGNELTSIFRIAQQARMATGIVSTARLTHATPAAAYGHTPERNWESDADMPSGAIEEGCVDLARQFIEGEVGPSLDVALGGGRGYFLPEHAEDPEGVTGMREDGRDLVEEWKKAHPGGRFVSNRNELVRVDASRDAPLLGLFASDHMPFESDRDRAAEPSLTTMASRALDILERSDGGYFLLVEAGRIDHAHHFDNAYRALAATVELSEAVAHALERTDPEETLIIVTSDHAHTMTISGYPTRGNPILGLVVGNDSAGNPATAPTLGADGKPYTTLSYANGPSAPRSGLRRDLRAVDTVGPNFQQPAQVPLALETHGGEDVPSYAYGPSAHLLTGTVEQNYVFHVMRRAAELD